MTTQTIALRGNELDRFVSEVSRYPVLDREAEQRLARQYRDDGDVDAAHKLVVSNLRFVIKIAHTYRGYGLTLLDLVQEGNIGLMHAVKKFDPDKGYRLISYAVWWIRAHIQSFVMRSWSLVKLGSGRVKRKLFFKLRSQRSEIEAANQGDVEATKDALAVRLGVSKEDISDMEARMAARDFSLDAPLADDLGARHLDMLEDGTPDPESLAMAEEEHRLLHEVLEAGSKDLNERESYILEHRLLADEPDTLATIGDEFGVSRERARQIEARLLKKLKAAAIDAKLELRP